MTNGITYYYQVTAVNAGGESPKSSEAFATPQLTAPSAPTGLMATAGNTQVTLAWTASTGAASYNIYRSTTPGGEGSTPYRTGITTTSFTDTGLTNGTTYYYQVTAVNAAGESPKSSEASATPASGPGRLTGTIIGTPGSWNNSGNTIAMAFDGDFNTSFDGPAPGNGDWVGLDLGATAQITQVKYAPRPGLESRMVGGIFQGSNTADFSSGVVNLFTISATPVAGSFTTQAITNPGTFRYVRYLGPNSSYGNVAELEFDGTLTNPTAPAAPTGLSATAGNTQVALAWNASTGAASYNLYRSTTPGGEGSTPYRTGLTTTAFTDTGLTNGITYYYQVTAVNAGGQSPKSSEAFATPQVPAPLRSHRLDRHRRQRAGRSHLERVDGRGQLQPLSFDDSRRRRQHALSNRDYDHLVHRHGIDQRHDLLLPGHRCQRRRSKSQVERSVRHADRATGRHGHAGE